VAVAIVLALVVLELLVKVLLVELEGLLVTALRQVAVAVVQMSLAKME